MPHSHLHSFRMWRMRIISCGGHQVHFAITVCMWKLTALIASFIKLVSNLLQYFCIGRLLKFSKYYMSWELMQVFMKRYKLFLFRLNSCVSIGKAYWKNFDRCIAKLVFVFLVSNVFKTVLIWFFSFFRHSVYRRAHIQPRTYSLYTCNRQFRITYSKWRAIYSEVSFACQG